MSESNQMLKRRRWSDWPFAAGVFLAAVSGALLIVSSVFFRPFLLPAGSREIMVGGVILGLLLVLIAVLYRSTWSSRFWPPLIVFACFLVLTGGAIFGFISTCGSFEGSNRSSNVNSFFAAATVIGVLLTIGAFIWLLIAGTIALFKAPKEDE